jgi:hypothetical protein
MQLLRENHLRAEKANAELKADAFLDKMINFKREEMAKVDTSELRELTKKVTSSLL